MSYNHFLTCLIVLSAAVMSFSCQFNDNKLGCSDNRALNYDGDVTIDDGSCEYSDAWLYNHPDSISRPDNEGHLIIMNESKEKLHLYANNQHLKIIPRRTSNFLVNLPDHADKLELAIYKVSQTDHVESPDVDQLFKRWTVVLPQNRKPDNQLKWVVSPFATSAGSGKIKLSYPSAYNGYAITNKVDVFLQSRTGAYIASLNPGRAHTLTMDYGVYKLYYRYWSSHSGDAANAKEVGWLESPYKVLNAAHHEVSIQIPAYSTLPENTAQLQVVNQMEESINLFWRNCLIDDVVLGYENTDGLAVLSPGHGTNYYLEEGSGDLTIRSMSGQQILSFNQLTLATGLIAKVEVGLEQKDFYCINKRDEVIYLGTPEYCGIAIQPYAEKWVQLPVKPAFQAFNQDKSYRSQVLIEGDNLIIN